MNHLQESIALIDQCVDSLSECAVEIGNLDSPENPAAKRARATMKAVVEFCERWQASQQRELVQQ